MKKLPPEYANVMITYIGDVFIRDRYYGHHERQTVTRRAFFSNSNGYYNNSDKWVPTPNGYFNVPQKWREHTWSDGTTSIMPFGFSHYGRVLPAQILNWEYETFQV